MFTLSYIHLSHSATLYPQSHYSKFGTGVSGSEYYAVVKMRVGGHILPLGFRKKLTFASMSKSSSLTIACALHFFSKTEKIQANQLLSIYTSYSVTISRIWLILHKLYYCTCRNNLFCFKLILATLDCSSICCRKKKLFAHSYCEFSSPRYVFKNSISQKTT